MFCTTERVRSGFVHQTLTFSRQRPRSVGAISADMGANFGSMLDILFTYGRACLLTQSSTNALVDTYLNITISSDDASWLREIVASGPIIKPSLRNSESTSVVKCC